MAGQAQGVGRFGIADLIPGLGSWIQETRQGIEQPFRDAAEQRALGLLGQREEIMNAGPVPGGMFGQGDVQTQAPSGLMADPGDFFNQMKYATGLMATPYYQQAGQGFAGRFIDNMLAGPARGRQEQQQIFDNALNERKFLETQQNNEQTSLTKNLIAAGLQPGTPQYEQAITDYLSKTNNTTINNIPASALSAQAWLDEVQNVDQQLEETGLDTYVPDLGDEMGSLLPGFTSNYVASPQYQQFLTLSDAWIQANLRPESGAVLGKDEIANYRKTYFPRAGDDAETVQRKRLLRNQKKQSRATQATQSAGGAGGVVDTVPAAAPAPTLDLSGFEPVQQPQAAPATGVQPRGRY